MSSADEIASLRRQRGVLKAACTRVKTYADYITTITPEISGHLAERKARLDGVWAEYNQIQTRLEDNNENESGDRVLFEDAFYSACATLRALMSDASNDRAAASASSPLAHNSASSSSEPTHIRLPKLNLPSFSGKYEDWYPFYNVFRSVIDGNNTLSDTQKFQYLKASLSGEAADVIHSLELTSENYRVAWDLLKLRFDNKRIIVQGHIRSIFELPNMAKENAQELRQIADGASKHLRALQSLGCPTDSWDDMLVYILSAKLDPTSTREWQTMLSGTELPTFKQFLEFTIKRCHVAEASNKKLAPAMPQSSNRLPSNPRRYPSSPASHVATVSNKCNYCRGAHTIYYCLDFTNLAVDRRVAEVKKRGLCANCLRPSNHTPSKCVSGSCRICHAKHNTLLHLDRGEKAATEPFKTADSPPIASPSSIVTAHSASSFMGGNSVLLATALIHARDSNGAIKNIRALLDGGSQVNIISRRCSNSLGLKTRALNISISCIDNLVANTAHIASLKVMSRINSFSATLDCIVADQVTDKLPSSTLRRSDIRLPRNIRLADPQFGVSSDIDMLIGADLFWELLCVGQIKRSNNCPPLQKTLFGWVVAGRLFEQGQLPRKFSSLHCAVKSSSLDEQLRLFWTMEEISNAPPPRSLEEQICEGHFNDNVSRNEQGRFVVKLPLKREVLSSIGDTRSIALRRFLSLERRLARDIVLSSHYVQFMREYEALGHMRRVDERADDPDSIKFYLPHHAVFKDCGGIAKIRVVFDGSCKGFSGVSLNDALRAGPVLQQDLISILTRFRTFRYVFTADIVKMYRQILVHPSHTKLQRILWRENATDDIQAYELTTVTYGTVSASYLATKCLAYLAEQESATFPIGSTHILRDFYMDDLLTGANTLEQAKLIKQQVISILNLGLFELSKWSSNSSALLANDARPANEVLDFNKDSEPRILGIRWNPNSDTFHFSIDRATIIDRVTKRTILSEVAKLFDPLGLLGPVILTAKLLIQELWQANIDWDESVPAHIHSSWLRFREQLSCLNGIKVPRLAKLSSRNQRVQVHGFCDASQRAYGACVYLRSECNNNSFRVELLCSKSRVAPLKAVSLPRLELCAALLLSRLLEKVRSSIDVTNMSIYLWSDSTITLQWISSCSRRWSVFVANRVGEVQRLTDISEWHHVESGSNAADILSRGAEPSELMSSDIWWHGPSFLQYPVNEWPISEVGPLPCEAPEERKNIFSISIMPASSIDKLMDRFSNLEKICRIIGYCRRFIKFPGGSNDARDVPLSPTELSTALLSLCKYVQSRAFSHELKLFATGKSLDSSSKLLSLSPFIDAGGLMRVGGRLGRSSLPYSSRHPIILPKQHRLTQLIIRAEHVRNLHAGVLSTIAAIRQRFWPISLRSVVRKVIHDCVICFKAKPVMSEARMGELPAARVQPSRPFSYCGVDYAGPFVVREGKRRNSRNVKAYVAIFVCFAVKAVHIELVGDLTTDSFLAAFKRFLSRRGNVVEIHSDNGTTFTGASRQLTEFYEFLRRETTQADIQAFLRGSLISWRFIPPNAPHFGGLWEAAVKSAKFHMHRTLGNSHLTFEELQTSLCEIEAILNSRPITPLTEDPNDLMYLTPGHFLIGESLNSYPCIGLTDVRENRLSRWQRVEQIRQHFWERWRLEYLSVLQERHKWKTNKGQQLQTGQMVLIKQRGLGPLQWLIGRVQEIHPGADGIARSATVRTAMGVLTRPLSKLAILPIET